MKKRKISVPLFFFLSIYLVQAQLIMIDSETGEYKYEEVVQADGLSKDQIKQRAKSWLNQYYTQIDSIAEDSIGIYQMNTYQFTWTLIKKSIPVELFFDVSIKVKPDRYKYEFHNFRVGKFVLGDLLAIDLKTYVERFPQAYQIYLEEPIDSEMTRAVESLKYFMVNNQMEKNQEEW